MQDRRRHEKSVIFLIEPAGKLDLLHFGTGGDFQRQALLDFGDLGRRRAHHIDPDRRHQRHPRGGRREIRLAPPGLRLLAHARRIDGLDQRLDSVIERNFLACLRTIFAENHATHRRVKKIAIKAIFGG